MSILFFSIESFLPDAAAPAGAPKSLSGKDG